MNPLIKDNLNNCIHLNKKLYLIGWNRNPCLYTNDYLLTNHSKNELVKMCSRQKEIN